MPETLIVDTDLGEALQENEKRIAGEVADSIGARESHRGSGWRSETPMQRHGCVQRRFGSRTAVSALEAARE
jgi:hypothetical protein